MKLKREEFQRSKEQDPLKLFRQGIRSKQTLEKYERTLKQLSTKVLEDILEGSFEERISQLVKHAKEDPDWTKDLLLNISKKLRERTRDPEDVKKIKQAQKLLAKAEDEANKTMDPRLKKKSDELFRKMQIISNKLEY